jgi:hypothetical protein
MNGFTLIEGVILLFLTLFILTISNQIFHYMYAVQPHLYQRREQEWAIFLIYLEENVNNCQNVVLTNSGVSLEMLEDPKQPIDQRKWINVEIKKGANQRVIFSKKGGTWIVLTKVRRVNYSLQNEILTVKATFEDGEVKSSRIKLAQIKTGKFVGGSD